MTAGLAHRTAYEAAWRLRPQGEPAWLARAREEAFERFLAQGFPTTREEDWRFTSVAPIAGTPYVAAPGVDADRARAAVEPVRLPGAAAEVVFVNGRYEAGLSRLPAGGGDVTVEPLADAVARGIPDVEASFTRLARPDHAFTALNTALMGDGACVRIAARAVPDGPVHVVFVTLAGGAPIMAHPRVLLIAGASSQAAVVESYAGDAGPYLTNAVTEVVVDENAVLDHYKVQREGLEAGHVSSLHVLARRNATVASHSLTLGGALVRNDVAAVLDGEGGTCALYGVYLAGGRRLVDNHTTIDHARPHCGSREIYKGILGGRARGVFNGRIVRPDAQKTDARQTSRALLLSEDAQINTTPQLDIFANNVKCTHGAAVGQMDEEAVFYLRARGLGAAEARLLLMRAFALDVLDRMPLAPVRARVEPILERQIASLLAAA